MEGIKTIPCQNNTYLREIKLSHVNYTIYLFGGLKLSHVNKFYTKLGPNRPYKTWSQ